MRILTAHFISKAAFLKLPERRADKERDGEIVASAKSTQSAG